MTAEMVPTTAETFDVLLVEDNPGDARLFTEMLRETDAIRKRVDGGSVTESTIHHETTLQAGTERLLRSPIDVVLLDLNLPKSSGLDTLETMLDAAGVVPIVVLTGLRDERLGLEAVEHGAQDYLVKDEVTSDLLVRSIHHALERNRQERARTRQREQLEALHTLTRELMELRSPVTLAEYVTDAAESMLGLPTVAIALIDPDAGCLQPVAATSGARSFDLESCFAVGDGPGWRAFVDGAPNRWTPAVETDAARGSDAEGTDVQRGTTERDEVSELLASPLGSHGVLVAGTTNAAGFEAADRDFVETVSSTLTATLDRIDRERELRDRERTLEAQNETLERLQRINDIIRRIDRSLVQASTRQEIETVVCEQLAAVDQYELAWVGQYDRLIDGLVTSQRAGAEMDVLDDVAVRTEDGDEAAGPTSLAVHHRSIQVVEDVAADPPLTRWQRDALERGIRSIVALPLSYEASLYSVLTVYSGVPGLFDGLELTVLEEMADTIAYALNAVESKKALVSEARTRLEFSLDGTSLALVEMARELDCNVVVERFVTRSDGGLRSFFTTRGATADAVRQFGHRLPITQLSHVSTYGTGGETVCRFGADLTDESLAARVVTHGGKPQTQHVEEGVATVEVDLASDAAVREFVEMFQSYYPEAELVAQRTEEPTQQTLVEARGSLSETLTDRQLEAIQTAYYNGYFEQPRERTGTEIATSMGIAQPTFNRHLRNAHQRLCQTLFEDSTDD
jgi:CheY-like chemotaxis protein/putative methionine-R-sulfoxide reductase with GAF domain/predicted DNA-binding protein (UPF0251 family)